LKAFPLKEQVNEMANESVDHNDSNGDAILPETGTAVLQSPFCASLRSKKFFMFDSFATESANYLDSSNHCWCSETHLVMGPDGGSVHPERCKPGRSCYSSALGEF
jgi:hypothetical protein